MRWVTPRALSPGEGGAQGCGGSTEDTKDRVLVSWGPPRAVSPLRPGRPRGPYPGEGPLTLSFPPQVNGLAALGKYEGSGDDSGAAGQSLYVANHAY